MERTNFVWLTVDSIRGDRTTMGGHDRDTTPTLARLGEADDAVATTCFSHAIWSQPSVASILTGTPPSRHGAGLHNTRLPDELPTVAERLSDIGYTTSGLSANPWFSSTTGTDRGFDEFDYYDVGDIAREVGPASLFSFLRNIRRFSAGFDTTKRKHSPDFLFNELVGQRIERLADGSDPFFFCAHYHGVHHPYYPAPAFQGAFVDGDAAEARAAADFAFEHTKDVYAEIGTGCPYSETEWEWIRSMYDAQLLQTDALVDRLVRRLDRLGLADDTVLVVTADHGDLLGEYDLVSHKLVLHDALLRVPLVVRGSERLANADLSLAQHTDVMQAILEDLGADTDGMCGRPLTDGSPDCVVAQRGAETREKTLDHIRKTVPDFDHDRGQAGLVTAYRTADWKYVGGDDSAFLYELPDEVTDHSAERPDLVERFGKEVESWLAAHGEPLRNDAAAEFEADVQQRLADLGYVTE
jgi:uncharacterized sulfatase